MEVAIDSRILVSKEDGPSAACRFVCGDHTDFLALEFRCKGAGKGVPWPILSLSKSITSDLSFSVSIHFLCTFVAKRIVTRRGEGDKGDSIRATSSSVASSPVIMVILLVPDRKTDLLGVENKPISGWMQKRQAENSNSMLT